MGTLDFENIKLKVLLELKLIAKNSKYIEGFKFTFQKDFKLIILI